MDSPASSRPRPSVSARLPGIGGRIKASSSDFQVEEIPLYEPCGAGEHVYVRHRRADRTTREIVVALARAFGLDSRDIGVAGLKDKRAVATQTFSVPLARVDPGEVARRFEAEVGGLVLDARRHGNKLRRGHSLGNRFEVTVVDAALDAHARALAIARELDARGLPNFFGPQRYGADGRNAEAGRARIRAPRRGWLAELQVSAWQSSLFDRWLAERLERGEFERVEAGDVAKKLDNGALFDVQDEAAENARVARREITYTGPMFGRSMRPATGRPGRLEAQLLADEGFTPADLAPIRLEGTRRAARVFVADLAISPTPAGLKFSFSLPKGSYATVLLSEFTREDVAVQDLDGED